MCREHAQEGHTNALKIKSTRLSKQSDVSPNAKYISRQVEIYFSVRNRYWTTMPQTELEKNVAAVRRLNEATKISYLFTIFVPNAHFSTVSPNASAVVYAVPIAIWDIAFLGGEVEFQQMFPRIDPTPDLGDESIIGNKPKSLLLSSFSHALMMTVVLGGDLGP